MTVQTPEIYYVTRLVYNYMIAAIFQRQLPYYQGLGILVSYVRISRYRPMRAKLYMT